MKSEKSAGLFSRFPLKDAVLLLLMAAAVYLYAREPSRGRMLQGTYEWFRALFGG